MWIQPHEVSFQLLAVPLAEPPGSGLGRPGGEAPALRNQGFFLLILPEPRKAPWRKLGIPYCVLDIPMPEVRLQRPRIVPRVRQGVAARMPQHVGMGLEPQPCRLASTLDHPAEARSVERGSAFGDKDEGAALALA
jgi:hypothetical protein